MKCSHFIRLTRDRIESVAKEVLCGIPNKRCAIPKHQKVNSEIVLKNKSVLSVDTGSSDDEDVEHWRPRKNKEIGYFKQGSLMANMKKFKPTKAVHKKPETVVDLTVINNTNNQTENNMVTPSIINTVKSFSTPGSYCSPIDKTPLKNYIYSNRLKKDINFYRQIIRNNVNKDKIEYTIGKHI